jgi:hypothetical protein
MIDEAGMITRREIALGGLLTVFLEPRVATCQHLNGLGQRRGCMLAHHEAEALFSRSSAHQLYATGNEPVVAKSGNRDFDNALAFTLSRMTDVLQVLPGFAYYDDVDGKNAYATDQRRLSNADGTVLFGLRLLREMLTEPEHPDVAVTAICAHEFGHIVQYKLRLVPGLLAGQDTVKRVELHADFLAGFYAGVRKIGKPDYPAAVFATTKYSKGDNFINNPNHHGRPEERASAIVRGFETAYRERRSLNDAIQIGIKYVSAL